jgi:hypothetical protein
VAAVKFFLEKWLASRWASDDTGGLETSRGAGKSVKKFKRICFFLVTVNFRG